MVHPTTRRPFHSTQRNPFLKPRLLIYNPAAGARIKPGRIEIIRNQFARQGWTIVPRPTTGPGTAAAIIAEHHPDIDGVIVAGGDGTINECLPALVGTSLFLAILPAGTANVLAHEIGVPRRMPRAVTALCRGRVQPVTVGVANGRHFLAFLGTGFDAQVAASVSPGLKRHWGKLAFVWEALRQLIRYRFPTARFVTPDVTLDAAFGIVSNTRLYGGGLKLTPRADMTTPELDLCVFDGHSAAAFVMHLLQVLTGTHTRRRSIHYEKITRLTIEGAGDIPYQVDGEPAGCLPVTVHSLPGALRLMYPDTRPPAR